MTLREKLRLAKSSVNHYYYDGGDYETKDGRCALSGVHDIFDILDDMIAKEEKRVKDVSVRNAIHGILGLLKDLAKRVGDLEKAHGWRGLKL